MSRRLLLVLLSLAFFATAVAGPTARIRAMATSPEQAVRAAVEADGAVYAGACAATRSPEDVGKICATFIDERGDTRAYLTGRTFSEYGMWLFVQGGPTGWTVIGSAPLDFFATDPRIPWPE
jgi:hypothetical protein